MTKKQRLVRTDQWTQLELRFGTPAQRRYETIRPVVLFGESAEERALETGEPVRTLYRNLQRFTTNGLGGLLEPDLPPTPRSIPQRVRELIVELKAEHARLSYNEIATICDARLEYHPAPQTVKRVLRESPPAPALQRRFPRFHELATEPAQRRAIIIRLFYEGWNQKSIADYMETSRKTVRLTLERWHKEGVGGLYPKSRAPKRRIRKVTLTAVLAVRTLHQNPRLGAFRTSTALKQKYKIHLSPRTVGRMLAKQRATEREKQEAKARRVPKEMPYKADYPHQFWSVDIRYLDMHRLGGSMIYTVTIIDNYSRSILSSAVVRSQNLTAYLCVLFAAIRNHGAPQAIVSDGGSVFRAAKVLEIYKALGIERLQIDKKQAWQNYVETQFNLLRIMGDHAVETATTWEELVDAHARLIADFNFQDHGAHSNRSDERRSPFQVLAWEHGAVYSEEDLRHLFYTLRFRRKLDRVGYLRFRNWRIYGNEGLPKEDIALWLHEEQLLLVFKDEPLAQYQVAYSTDHHDLSQLTDPQLYPSRHRIPQLRLLDISEGGWRLTYRVTRQPARKKPEPSNVEQQSFLFEQAS